jgi:hypothetical protein
LLLNRVSQKSWRSFARLYLESPWDYKNGIVAKRCVSSSSFVWVFLNVKHQRKIKVMADLRKEVSLTDFCAFSFVR